jgi:ketosteroid isomerase-like protein
VVVQRTYLLFSRLFVSRESQKGSSDTSTEDEVRQACDQYDAALNQLYNGDATLMMEVWSHSADVTALHPVAGRKLGWEQIRASWEQVAQLCSGGQAILRDPLIRVGTDLAYVVGTTEVHVTIAGEVISYESRVTRIFRREAGVWKCIHQHVDIAPALQAIINRLQAASGESSS